MNIEYVKQKRLLDMTGEEFSFLLQQGINKSEIDVNKKKEEPKRHVYGINGLAKLFGCSVPTANRIKQSGKIDSAITQIGRKIIVDAELALQLAGQLQVGRR